MKKSEKEKQMLYEWGFQNYSEDNFVQIEETKKSYFQKRLESSYIKEYTFETFPEFMEELNVLWENDEAMEKIKKVIGVIAMKNKPIKMDDEQKRVNAQSGQEEKLPVFIYNF